MLSIQTNVNSLVAQENLSVNSKFQSQTIQRLTSGYRINSSADDAAGLAVANKFRSDVAELSQGVRNANDGISQLQIIDGGLNNISQMLDRLKTLATQSASTTFTGDRSTVNSEFQSVLSEINRQAADIKLDANGTFKSKMSVYIGGGNASNATNSNAQVSVDLSSSQVDAAGLGISSTSVLGGGVSFAGNSVNTLNDSGVNYTATTISLKYIDSNGTSQSASVTTIGGNGAAVVKDLNSKLSNANVPGITAQIGNNGDLQFVGSGSFTVKASGGSLVNGGGLMVNTGKTNMASQALTVYSGTTANDVLTITDAKTGKSDTYTMDATNSDTFSNAINNLNKEFKAKGLALTALDDQSGSNKISIQSSGDFVITNVHTAGTGGFATTGAFTLAANNTSTAADVNATATGAAVNAIDAIANANKLLGLTQGRIGAGQNQLSYAINLAQSQIANFSSAQSQIRDADVASEAANLTKAQVLQQASIAAMAQANSAPQAVLSLLRG